MAYQGDALAASCSWSVGGVSTDPTTVTLKWQTSEGAPWTSWVYGVDEEIVKTTAVVAGLTVITYRATVTCDDVGTLTTEWIGTGAAAKTAVETEPVYARPSSVPL